MASQHREDTAGTGGAADALLADIRAAWSWLGADPVHLIATNAFGNVLFTNSDSRIWRLCPEDLSCSVTADNRAELDQLLNDPDFLLQWEMESLVLQAHAALGSPGEARCYCLKLPGPLGGAYEVANIGTISIAELIAFSGYLAKQIADIPDGGQVQIVFE